MPNVSKWANVDVAMQSALGANLPITAITKANPGVVSIVGHGLVAGAFVLMTVQGMSKLNMRVFRVANENVNDFELEGEDTTLFETFVSGFANEITFGTTLATLTDLSASGGDFDFIDTTTIHDTVKSQIPGTANPAVYTFGSIWDAQDVALEALKVASDNQALRAFRMTFSNQQKVVFNGYVGATKLPVGNSQDKVTTPVVITMFGLPTDYAT